MTTENARTGGSLRRSGFVVQRPVNFYRKQKFGAAGKSTRHLFLGAERSDSRCSGYYTMHSIRAVVPAGTARLRNYGRYSDCDDLSIGVYIHLQI